MLLNKKLIITGFDEFGDHKLNPTKECIQHLDSLLDRENIQPIVLPTSYKRSWEILKTEIETFNPEVIIMLGLAHKATEFSFEKIAINFASATIADNDGVKKMGETIIQDGVDGIFTSLHIESILKNVGGRISLSAGSYVCNSLFFNCLHHMRGKNVEIGFIHIPGETYSQLEINSFVEKVINFAIKK